MRIVLAIGSLGLGGAERQCVELALQLKRQSYSVWVYYLNNTHIQLLDILKQNNIPTRFFNYKSNLPFVLKRIRQCINNDKIDVVHTFLFTAGYICRLALLFHPKVIKVHAERMGDYKRPRRKHYVDYVLKFTTHYFIANSTAGLNYLQKNLKISSNKCTYIANGIDFSRINAISPKKDNDSCIIIMVGRISPEKNYEFALNLVLDLRKINPLIKLKIVGDIVSDDKFLLDYKNMLLHFVQVNELSEFVDFLGYRNDVAEILATSDIFLSTSLHEGCPNAMIEAMASGLPVVVPDISDNSNIVKRNRCGFVVHKTKDTREYVKILSNLIENEELRQVLGKNAKERALDFSIEKLGQKHIGIYRKLIKRESP